MKKLLSAIAFVILNPTLALAQAVSRFPKPDFQSEYFRPSMQTPAAKSQLMEFLDVFVLIGALSLASYFALKLRSRRKMFLLMIFSLIYFGFFRKGCICPVGSVQNISLGIFNSGYAIPLTAIAFFALPLIFTLFFGRTFCAAVCPLGAIQDTVVLRPVNVAPWLAQVLGIFPYVYLGLAVLFASTGAGFIICQYDPFVGFFRFGASFNMIVLGISMLMLGTVVARPYCRFLCPYGVLLNWMSRLSKWHARISPDECINCRLCEESCPFGAIDMPTGDAQSNRDRNIKQLAVLFLLVPVIVLGSGWVVSRLHAPLSAQHSTVALADTIMLENSGARAFTTEESDIFRASGKPSEELFAEADILRDKFKTGAWVLGLFLGCIVCVKLIGLTMLKRHTEYTTNTGHCLSCARCFSYCPIEQVRLGNMAPEEAMKLKQSIE
jgi:NosR/NirI family transcriptional regulator, nitrous oxide reductase regulator